MTRGRDLLLVDTGSCMELLAGRLRRLGYRTLWAKTSMEAYAALEDPLYDVGAVVMRPDLAATDLRRALEAFRSHARDAALAYLVTGQRPELGERRRLRDAGVTAALWEPIDQHALRFQVNRALAQPGVVRGRRGALRAPAVWPARVWADGREKQARVYSASAAGVFLATPRPSPRNVPLRIELPLPSGRVALAGRVVMTNVPGNLMRRTLPVGMGVRFEQPPVEVQATLELWATKRFRSLVV